MYIDLDIHINLSNLSLLSFQTASKFAACSLVSSVWSETGRHAVRLSVSRTDSECDDELQTYL